LSGFTSLAAIGSTGDDSLDFSDLTFGAILAGGDGNDTIIGTPFDDVIFGDAGDDVLIGDLGFDVIIGGPGIDALDGSGGDNVLIQEGGSSDLEPLPRPTQIPAPGSLLLLLVAFVALALRKTLGECT
jgi:Ca2+-binding RTX toxin-like protein